MTISTMASVVTYAGNGVTTRFDWTFPIPSGALEVYRTENNVATLIDHSSYSVSGLDDPNGGTVAFAEAPALGQTITIKRNVGLTQDVALVTGSAFYAEVVEGAFDHATMQIQQLAEEMGRAVQVPIGSGLDPADYLDAAARSAAAASAAASSAADSATDATAAQSGSETARDEAVAAAAAITLPLPVESGGTGATTPEEARANLGVMDGAPVGSLLFQSVRETHVPPGYILGNGAPVTETYPELRALYIADGYPYGQDASGNPLTPNYPGYTLRGWLPGQLVDSGRVWGAKQEDALQKLTGKITQVLTRNNTVTQTAGVFLPSSVGDGNANLGGSSGDWTGTAIEFSAASSPGARVADETRMKNIPVVVWIKAYAANTDPGSIDLANLTNDIQVVGARTSILETSRGHTNPINAAGLAAYTFVNLPKGTRRIQIPVRFMNPSVNASFFVALGTEAGLITSGYTGTYGQWGASSAYALNSTGFVIFSNASTNIQAGMLTLTLLDDNNMWLLNGSGAYTNTPYFWQVCGNVSLPGELAQIRIAPSAGVFTSGNFRLYWEK